MLIYLSPHRDPMFVPNETPLRLLNQAYLNERESELFDSICDALGDGRDIVDMPTGMDRESVGRVTRAVQFDSFDFYKVDRRKWYEVRDGMFTIHYQFDTEHRREMERMLEMTVTRICEHCEAACKTDFEKEVYIHDYLADTVTYTHDTHIDDMAEQSSFGALVEGKAVCEGIAKATCILLNRLGLDCGCVVNKTHMWNIVNLEGEYYNLDVTWDLRQQYKTRDYLNVDDRTILSTHICDYGPQCCGQKYNWYRYNGLHLTSLDEIYTKVREFVESGQISMGFRYEGPDDRDARDVTHQAIRDSHGKGYLVWPPTPENTIHITMATEESR